MGVLRAERVCPYDVFTAMFQFLFSFQQMIARDEMGVQWMSHPENMISDGKQKLPHR
jgi:hypothetical protein